MRSTRWRVEFQENLARKDAEEKMKMEELKAKAKKELEDWWAWTMFWLLCFHIKIYWPSISRTRHKNYKEEMARTKEENRWKSPESLTHDDSQKKGRGRNPVPESFPWNCSHRRVAEQAFLEDVNGLKPGSEWDRVAKNCDFNSKVISKDHNVDVEVHFRFSLSNTKLFVNAALTSNINHLHSRSVTTRRTGREWSE